ncbi:hypothetical protein LOAG_02967 [Loa loa]|uniref:Uncharacterized protein n=1 Tax=Loa loa TaxID=7209 RepID=A0A1S0U7E9_LOALO|nr:hypothetical protein LOAG_02967 [Loa loa]EFO25515.2 hypothetical protein LOAG_02967 [Loa loa]
MRHTNISVADNMMVLLGETFSPDDCYHYTSSTSSSSSSSSSSSCSSSEYDGDECDSDLSPRALLTMAIQRRRVMYNSKERDLRRELLHTSFIQSLCKHLGERRAKRHQQRRAAKRHRRRSSRENRKREYSSSSWSESDFGLESHPGIIMDDFSGCLDLSASEPEKGGGGGNGETGQFDGYNDNLYSLLQQDNCVQLPSSNVMEADNILIEPPPPPPVCFKKSRFSQPDADPFGLDALFDELYGKTMVASVSKCFALKNKKTTPFDVRCKRDRSGPGPAFCSRILYLLLTVTLILHQSFSKALVFLSSNALPLNIFRSFLDRTIN